MNKESNFCPSQRQKMTMMQELQHRGANEIISHPLQTRDVIWTYRPAFDVAFGLDKRVKGTAQESYAKFGVERDLRRMLFRPLGHFSRAITRDQLGDVFAAIELKERGILPAGLGHGSFWGPHVAQNNRRHEGEYGGLMALADHKIGKVTKQTLDLFDKDEKKALYRGFKSQTHRMKTAAGEYLDNQYPLWRGFKEGIQTASSKSKKKLPYEMITTMRALDVSDNILEAFTASSTSAAETVTAALSDLHTACYDAGIPQQEWWPLSYRYLRMLAITSQLVRKSTGKIMDDFYEPDRPNLFAVSTSLDDSIVVDFNPNYPDYAYLKKAYEKHEYNGCPGAAEGSFYGNELEEYLWKKFQRRVANHAYGNTLDVDFVNEVSSAEMFALMTVAYGERDEYRLNRHSERPTKYVLVA